ncbi:MAG TPA: IucA/IucC family protein, partial [Pseudonocardiaceae bacterium]|nr:IucA/IucC family protein [Pseudonocardiaceae bacterium]
MALTGALPGAAPPYGAALVENAVRAPQYAQVRRRILRQLLESLIYEGVLTAASHGDRHGVGGTDESGKPVVYRFTMGLRYGFDRVRLGAEPVTRLVSGREREAESLTRFLIETREQLGAEPERVVGFARELEETLLKDAVAQYVRVLRADVLAGAEYNALESMVMDGHLYHPAYKSRLGFDLEDHLAWGPEFTPLIHPLWLAARRSVATVTVSDRHTEGGLLRGQLGQSYDEFHDRIRRAGGDPAKYTLLPVHPWQWREVIAHSHADALRDGDLIVLGEDPDAHWPQQSIRTLA